MDEGAKQVYQLTRIVEATDAFRKAKSSDELILLPTGDGMALVFFGDPTAPVECAADISRALKQEPSIKLRMGIHSGPVYRTVDINKARNVAGGGINLAQRVMDCGDEGHILVSQSVADVLRHLSGWRDSVHDLGDREVKHGERVRIFNFYGDDFGNPEPPKKGMPPSGPPKKPESRPIPKSVLVAAVLALVVIAAALSWESIYCRISPESPGCVAGAGPSSGQTLAYWLTLQRYRDGEPFGEPRRLAREAVFERGDRIFLHLSSPQDGYLYIINEGPYLVNGLPSYNLLFPNTAMNNGEPFLRAEQQLQIPQQGGFVFDQEEGTERLWFVWAAEPVPVLEQIKGIANPTDQGVVTEPRHKQEIQSFLQEQWADEPLAETQDEPKQTLVQEPGDVLVYRMLLEHL